VGEDDGGGGPAERIHPDGELGDLGALQPDHALTTLSSVKDRCVSRTIH